MNPLSILKLGAATLLVVGAYFFGLSQGHDSEQLKLAQSQVSQLTDTIKRYETKQKEQTIALAELRVSESAARADSDRMRDITDTIKRYETKQKEQTIALAELRVSESAARADSDRMRDRIASLEKRTKTAQASLEKRTKTAQARDTVRCLELGAECRELLQQARGALNYCRKALQ